MDENIVHDIPQLTQEENDILTADFLVKEVYEAISQMELNKAPGQMVSLLSFIRHLGGH